MQERHGIWNSTYSLLDEKGMTYQNESCSGVCITKKWHFVFSGLFDLFKPDEPLGAAERSRP